MPNIRRRNGSCYDRPERIGFRVAEKVCLLIIRSMPRVCCAHNMQHRELMHLELGSTNHVLLRLPV
jgi:hypothetical protein